MSDSGKFIVVFKDHVTTDQIDKYIQEIGDGGGEVTDRWDTSGIVHGVSATLKPGQLQNYRADNDIKAIEVDGPVTIRSSAKRE